MCASLFPHPLYYYWYEVGMLKEYEGTQPETPPPNPLKIRSHVVMETPTIFYFLFFYLTYSRWTPLPSCLWSLRIFPSLPGSRLTIFYRDASSALLQLSNQWLNFTYSRSHAFRYERKNTKSYFGKNRTHDFRTINRRCAGYLLDHSGDEYKMLPRQQLAAPSKKTAINTSIHKIEKLISFNEQDSYKRGNRTSTTTSILSRPSSLPRVGMRRNRESQPRRHRRRSPRVPQSPLLGPFYFLLSPGRGFVHFVPFDPEV